MRDNRSGRKARPRNRECAGAALRAGATALLTMALAFALLGMTGGRVMLTVISVTVVLRRGSSPSLGRVRGARVDRLRHAQVQAEPHGEGCCHDPLGVTTHGVN